MSVRIIAVINQKGGVGKTTTTANLAHALALMGKHVTAIDLDPQGHLGASLGVVDRMIHGIDDVLLHGTAIADVTMHVRENLDLIPAGSHLIELEQQPNDGSPQGRLLKEALSGQFESQDFVLIDCPPSSGLLVVNALFATKEVLTPVSGDYLSLHGLSTLIGTFKNFEEQLGHTIQPWITLTRFHARRRLAQQVQEKLQHYFSGKVLKTPIREAAALAECPGMGKTIFEYRKSCKAADDFSTLASDLVSGRTM